jgi:hypothetical protein
METRYWHGRDGIRIPEFGLAVPISRSDLASESVGSVALGGAGAIGASTGITITPLLTMAGTTRGAALFTIETTTTAVEVDAVDLTAADLTAVAVNLMATAADVVGLSMEMAGRLEGTANRVVRAAHGPARSVAMATAGPKGAFRPAAAPVSAAEEASMAAEGSMEAEAGAANRSFSLPSGQMVKS